jgi:AcrR family transcriptional regulator
MTTPRPGSRAEQRLRTETRILDAATEVFFSAGYDRTTIRAVASAAGVDAGLVMHYFGSKQELYRRVIDTAPVPEISGTSAEAAEQVLAGLAGRLENEPVASLALLRSMLTNPEAASAASDGIARYEAQIAQAIPADDAGLRAAIISAITLGITVSRHLLKSDELATADPEQIIGLLRPCVLSLAATPAPLSLSQPVTLGSPFSMWPASTRVKVRSSAVVTSRSYQPDAWPTGQGTACSLPAEIVTCMLALP